MCKFPVGILLFVCNLALVAQAKDSLVPEDPADRVGPGIADLFERDGPPPLSGDPKSYACRFSLAALSNSPKTLKPISNVNLKSGKLPAFGYVIAYPGEKT